MTLFKDLNCRPMIVIRFNPDSYIDSENNKIQSCFIRSETGIYKANNNELEERMKEVYKLIEYHINNVPEKEITLEYLYYNEN